MMSQSVLLFSLQKMCSVLLVLIKNRQVILHKSCKFDDLRGGVIELRMGRLKMVSY
jgi:hypothetical protein